MNRPIKKQRISNDSFIATIIDNNASIELPHRTPPAETMTYEDIGKPAIKKQRISATEALNIYFQSAIESPAPLARIQTCYIQPVQVPIQSPDAMTYEDIGQDELEYIQLTMNTFNDNYDGDNEANSNNNSPPDCKSNKPHIVTQAKEIFDKQFDEEVENAVCMSLPDNSLNQTDDEYDEDDDLQYIFCTPNEIPPLICSDSKEDEDDDIIWLPYSHTTSTPPSPRYIFSDSEDEDEDDDISLSLSLESNVSTITTTVSIDDTSRVYLPFPEPSQDYLPFPEPSQNLIEQNNEQLLDAAKKTFDTDNAVIFAIDDTPFNHEYYRPGTFEDTNLNTFKLDKETWEKYTVKRWNGIPLKTEPTISTFDFHY